MSGPEHDETPHVDVTAGLAAAQAPAQPEPEEPPADDETPEG